LSLSNALALYGDNGLPRSRRRYRGAKVVGLKKACPLGGKLYFMAGWGKVEMPMNNAEERFLVKWLFKDSNGSGF